jgi:hypothetical protein
LLYPSFSNWRTLLKLVRCARVSAKSILESLPIHGNSAGRGNLAVNRECSKEITTNRNGIQTKGLESRSMTALTTVLSNGTFCNCPSSNRESREELDHDGITMIKGVREAEAAISCSGSWLSGGFAID